MTASILALAGCGHSHVSRADRHPLTTPRVLRVLIQLGRNNRSLFYLGECLVGIQFVAFTIYDGDQGEVSFLLLFGRMPAPSVKIQTVRKDPAFHVNPDGDTRGLDLFFVHLGLLHFQFRTSGMSKPCSEVALLLQAELAWRAEGFVKLPASTYPRQREYPHPPPPKRNNTRRTIKTVVICCTSSRSTTVQVADQSRKHANPR